MSWRRFLNRKHWDDVRSLEITSYLEAETADNIARGMTRAEAAATARRTFGNETLIREEIYRMNTVLWLETLAQDVRYGARLLMKSPGFTVVAAISLAFGIGANMAIFQLIDAVRLRSLPVQNPHELAEIKIAGGHHGLGISEQYGEMTRPLWEEIRRNHPGFSGVFAWRKIQQMVKTGNVAEPVNSLLVTGDALRTLGLQPWRGRLIVPDDERACPYSAVMVSYAYWQSRLGGRDVIAENTKLIIDDVPAQVVGITPPSFFGLAVGESFDVVASLCRPPRLARNVFDVTIMGRLLPAFTLSRASQQLAALSSGMMTATQITGYDSQATSDYLNFKLAAYPAATGVSYLRDSYDKSLQLLFGITGLVLLIACANLANLMLARATTRDREIAVRLALGASRTRLLRQLLVESSLLSIGGAVLGMGLAQLLSRALVQAISTEGSVITLSTTTDLPVLLFAAFIAMCTCVIFGMVPALTASGLHPGAAIRAGGRGMTANRERFSIQRVMAAVQTAVSLVLLFSAFLFVHSFHSLLVLDPGMREKGVVAAFANFSKAQTQTGIEEYKRQLVEEIRGIPGVQNAASTTNEPLMGTTWGHEVTVRGADGQARFTWVSPGYFDTMGIRLLGGRGFSQNDTGTSVRVALVNQTFIHRYLDGLDPIGQLVRTHAEPNYPSTVYQIIGTIPDTKYESLRSDATPMVFAPASQFPDPRPWTVIMIYSSRPAGAIAKAVTQHIAATHPEITIECRLFESQIQDGLVRERIIAMLSGFFGVLATLLATVGLYGVIGYIVTRRRNEIGIRIAIGAARGEVIGLVMREALLSLAGGLIVGILLALVAGREAGSLLFGLKPNDPLMLSASVLLLLVVGAFAAFLPAWRAAQLDPSKALRCE